MSLVLIENRLCPIVSEEVKSKFPQPSIRVVSRDTTKSELDKLKRHPLLTKKWLVLVEEKVSSVVIEDLLQSETCYVVIFANQTNYLFYIDLCKRYGDYKFIDASKLDEKANRDYVKKRLGVGKECSDIICTYCNEYLPYIEEAIITLESLNREIKTSDVTKYLSKRTNITVYSLFYHLVEIRQLNQKSLTLFLYQFRFALPYLKKSLMNIIDTVLKIYVSIDNGELGNDNVVEYLTKTRLKVSKYFVTTTVSSIYPSVDYDSLLLLRIRIEKTESIIQLLSYL